MVVYNEAAEELVVFAVNKDLEEDMEVSLDLRQFSDYAIIEHIVLHHPNLKAVNTEDNPNNVVPVNNGKSSITDGILTAVLKSRSWNVIRMK